MVAQSKPGAGAKPGVQPGAAGSRPRPDAVVFVLARSEKRQSLGGHPTRTRARLVARRPKMTSLPYSRHVNRLSTRFARSCSPPRRSSRAWRWSRRRRPEPLGRAGQRRDRRSATRGGRGWSGPSSRSTGGSWCSRSAPPPRSRWRSSNRGRTLAAPARATSASSFGAPAGGAGERRLCLGGRSRSSDAGLVVVDAAGMPTEKRTVAVTPEAAAAAEAGRSPSSLPTPGCSPQRYGWRVARQRRLRGPPRCAEELPAEAARRRGPSACARSAPSAAPAAAPAWSPTAPRPRPVVALTFDDGPSDYTDRFLDVLREKQVPATFFEIGQEMPGREARCGGSSPKATRSATTR